MKRIIGIFDFMMDNSTRAFLFKDMPSVNEYAMKYKDICVLVVAFEVFGEILFDEPQKP